MSHPSNPDHIAVDPQPGLAPWIGGKRHLARRLAERIDAIPHTCYAEPFVGMGGVFFRRRRRPKVEAINDRSHDVANLFRVLQRHPAALIDHLVGQRCARAEFDRQGRVEPDLLTDIERASRFAFLQYCSYAGKPAGRNFQASPTTPPRLSSSRVASRLRQAHVRLDGVYIDCSDFERFIRRWDRPTTMFYIDPPYWGAEGVYGRELFERADFERLANTLRGISGRFLLSLNDRPDVRETFAVFAIETVETTYHIGGSRRVTELLISG